MVCKKINGGLGWFLMVGDRINDGFRGLIVDLVMVNHGNFMVGKCEAMINNH